MHRRLLVILSIINRQPHPWAHKSRAHPHCSCYRSIQICWHLTSSAVCGSKAGMSCETHLGISPQPLLGDSRGIQWWWCSDSLSKLRTWLETCWPLSLPASSLHFRCTATAQFFFFYFFFIFGWVAKACRYFTGLKVTEEVTIGGCSKYPCSSLVDLLTRTWEAQKGKTQSHPPRLSLPVVHCGKLA